MMAPNTTQLFNIWSTLGMAGTPAEDAIFWTALTAPSSLISSLGRLSLSSSSALWLQFESAMSMIVRPPSSSPSSACTALRLAASDSSQQKREKAHPRKKVNCPGVMWRWGLVWSSYDSPEALDILSLQLSSIQRSQILNNWAMVQSACPPRTPVNQPA